jgi:hypothetical protein
MRHKSILYPVCRVDLVELAPGESFSFSQKAASASYGVFALGGTRSAANAVETTDPDQHAVTTMTSGAVPGRIFNHVGKWIPNTPDAGWSNDGLGHEPMTITAGDQGAYWICLSRSNNRELVIEHIKIIEEKILSENCNFLLVRGNAELEKKSLKRLDYVAEKSFIRNIFGYADCLILK